MYKKFFYPIFIVAILFFHSCGSDDDPVTITIDNPNVTIDFDENPSRDQVITIINASTNKGFLTYQVASETPSSGATAINIRTGELTVADVSEFDFEKYATPVLTITVRVSNGDVSETATVTINLQDLADEVTMGNETVTMDENPSNGQAVVTMSATVDTGSPRFSITSQSPARTFSIDANSGEITIADFTILDFETNPTLTIEVRASNGPGSDDATVTVTLNNLLETLSTQNETVSLDENPAADMEIVTVTGTTDLGSASFSLQSESVSGAFAINTTTGVLTVADASKFDYETNPTLTANISVTNSPLEETAVVTVNLNDLLELSWTEATSNVAFGGVYGHEIVNLNGTLYSIGGIRGTTRINEVWSSTDGTTWTQVNTGNNIFSPRNGFQAVVFNNKIWVIGGFIDGGRSNQIWSSADGATWTETNTTSIFTPRSDHAAVVFNNKIWVVGGSDGVPKNEVWSSTDGATWTQETTSGNIFSGRLGHTLTVFNGTMTLIGGADLDNQQLLRQRNDIWTSTDGINWTEVSVTGNLFLERWIHGAIVHNNLLWVIGGDDDTGNRFNDVWTTADGGATWTQQTSNPIFAPRDQMALFVLNNKLWVSGGSNNNGILTDIWVTN
ncbi:MAG: hypothetical protein HEP71_00720 [Roseivirga sp.]|nr:hypothetical protein [Roseivirga sp.]